MGIDRDLNGVLDADEPLPRLQIREAGSGTVLHWPLSAVGFRLQAASSLSEDSWSNASSAVVVVGDQNFVTNSMSPGTKFFRLRQP